MHKHPIVIIDTNVIVFGIENSVDIFEVAKYTFPGCTTVISKGILHELHLLADKRGKFSPYAKAAIKLVENSTAEINADEGNVDKWIERYIATDSAIAITNDMKLKSLIKKKNRNAKVFSLGTDGKIR